MSQCNSVTEDGERCKRNAFLGSRYCWQHTPKLVRWAKSLTLGTLVTAILAVIGFIADVGGICSMVSGRTAHRPTPIPTPTHTLTLALVPTLTRMPTLTLVSTSVATPMLLTGPSSSPTTALLTQNTPIPKATPSPTSYTITVTSIDGKTYKVKNLVALYSPYVPPGEIHIVDPPPKMLLPVLLIDLDITRDRITITKELRFPFTSMKQLLFKAAPLPDGLDEMFEGQEPIRIDLLDGTIVLLGDGLLAEIDAQGNQIVIEFDQYSFSAGEWNRRSIRLSSFFARARTDSGEEGDFSIGSHEVKGIEFEHP